MQQAQAHPRRSHAASLLLAEQILRTGAHAALAFWAAFALGPAGWGDWSTAMAVGVLALSLSQLGLDAPLVAHLARRGPRSRDAQVLVAQAAVLRAGAGAVLFVPGAALAAWSLAGDGSRAATLMLLWAVLAAPMAAEAMYKAWGPLARLARLRLAVTTVATVTKASVLAAGGGALALAAAALAEAALLSSLIWLSATRPDHPGLGVKPRARRLRALARAGLPALLPALAAAALLRLDLLVVAAWTGPATAGQYALAQRCMELLLLAPMLGVEMLAGAALAGRAASPADRQHIYDLASAAAWLAAAAGGLVGPGMLARLAGPMWQEAALLLAVMAWLVPPLVLEQVRLRDEIARGNAADATARALWLLIGGGAASMLAVPLGGPLASAAATTLVAWCGLLLGRTAPTASGAASGVLALRSLWPWRRLLAARGGGAATR